MYIYSTLSFRVIKLKQGSRLRVVAFHFGTVGNYYYLLDDRYLALATRKRIQWSCNEHENSEAFVASVWAITPECEDGYMRRQASYCMGECMLLQRQIGEAKSDAL